MSERILGIDLGTTNSAVGVVESGFPILLANQEGKRIIPSAVYFGDGEVQVGEVALRRKQGAPDRVVTSVKRLMGMREVDAEGFPQQLKTIDGELHICIGDQLKTPVEVSSAILKALKQQATEKLEETLEKAVITVPAYFNDAQRAATKKAGELAGLEVIRVLSEPTAAALSYGLDKLEEKSSVVVYDFGGGTFDVSLLELQGGVFEVIATSGDTQLGGDDVDLTLCEWMKDQLGISHEVLGVEVEYRLLEAAREAKIMLTDQDQTSIKIPFLTADMHVDLELTKVGFEKLIAPLISRTLKHCRQVMTDADRTNETIGRVVLVGGSTRIPSVQAAVGEFFDTFPDTSQHPDEAIALGAVIQAGVLSGAISDIVLLDVTPLSLGIETLGGLMNVIIPRNATIPCKAGEMFTNAIDDQASMAVKVLQGEREMARDNWVLGEVDVHFSPSKRGQARVGVQFSLDENGILEVLARDTSSGVDTILEIKNTAVDVEDSKVEKMVSESVDYALEDMSERVFTEAKLKAEELLPAVGMAISQCEGLIEESDIEDIEQSKQEVLAAIDSGDGNRLKLSVQTLDKKTEHLAAILVEKVMEESLMRKLGDAD